MKPVFCLAFALFVAIPASAGPNAGGTIIVHDAGIDYTSGDISYCSEGALLIQCDRADVQIDGPEAKIWKVYAAFPGISHPRLKGISFGAVYDPGVVLLANGPCPDGGVVELPETGWPESGTGTSLIWDETITDRLVEIYWFAGFNDVDPESAIFELSYPGVGPAMFADDSLPALLDPIAGFGAMGFNRSGWYACSTPPYGACCFEDGHCEWFSLATCMESPNSCSWISDAECDPNPCGTCIAACCFDDGTCAILPSFECRDSGGTVMGWNDCDPNPCGPTVTEETNWGRIKARYR